MPRTALHRSTLLLLLAGAGCIATAEPVVVVPTELAAVHAAAIAAWHGTDAAALRPYYADNAVVVTGTERYTGWEDMHTRWLTPSIGNMRNLEIVPLSFTRDGADIIETGRYEFEMTVEGEAQEMAGTYSQRWQRGTDGTWRIVSVTAQ